MHQCGDDVALRRSRIETSHLSECDGSLTSALDVRTSSCCARRSKSAWRNRARACARTSRVHTYCV